MRNSEIVVFPITYIHVHCHQIQNSISCGSFPWTAPEVFANGRSRTASDVYSFGVILWELLTRSIPFPQLSAEQIVWQVCMSKMRLPIPEMFPKDVNSLLNLCWER